MGLLHVFSFLDANPSWPVIWSLPAVSTLWTHDSSCDGVRELSLVIQEEHNVTRRLNGYRSSSPPNHHEVI